METKGFSKSPNVFSPSEDAPILIMNIDIGRGSFEQLIIRKNENIRQAALNFCSRFNLNGNLSEILITNIENNLKDQENDEFLQENSGNASIKYEKKRSLAEIYNDQKQNHSENLVFENNPFAF